MIDAKTAAKELVDKFKDLECDSDYDDAYMCEHLAKSCALICVDEILSILFQHHEIDYWEKVKEEIQKL